MSYGTPPPPPPGGQPPYGENPYGQQSFGAPPSGDPGTLDLPYYGIGFVPAVQRAFQKYARFDGRASRSEYWWFSLALGLVALVLYIPLVAASAAGSDGLVIVFALLLFALFAAMIVPSIAIAVRRLHDANFSGWMYLLGFIPGCGGIIQIVLMCLPSKPEGARFDRAGGAGGGGGGGYGQPNPYGQSPYGQ